MTRELTCMCEEKLTIDVPDVVDLEAEPAREEQILDGSFLSTRCPRCGKLIKPELPMRVRDASRGLDLYLVPGMDRNRYFLGTLEGVPEGVGRVVIGFPELQEKLRIANAKLDDRVVEIAKFHLMRRAEADSSGRDVAIYFASRGGGALTFEVYGVREGEVGKVRVPEEAIERIASELSRNLKRDPYRAFLVGPYVSCSRVYEAEGGEQEDGAEGDAT